MSDTFNDGDPIDAATLQKLKTEVAQALAVSSAKVNAGSTINAPGSLNDANAADLKPAVFFGGKSEELLVTAGKKSTFTLDYQKAGFIAKPSSIILTAISKDGLAEVLSPSIIKGTIGKDSAKAQIWGAGRNKNITLFFLAVQNQS
jgi:hypothetical protein